MTIPQPFTLILPIIASSLAGWLKDAKFPRWANYAIIIIAFVLAVVASILLGGGLTGNAGADLGIILAECAAVFALLKPLMDQATVAVPSPLTLFVRKKPVPAVVAPVAQRASAMPQGMSWASMHHDLSIDDHDDAMPTSAIPATTPRSSGPLPSSIRPPMPDVEP